MKTHINKHSQNKHSFCWEEGEGVYERWEEQHGPKCLLWCPHVHMTLRDEDSSLGGPFAHVGGFPTWPGLASQRIP